MAKYTYEFKLDVVKKYLNNEELPKVKGVSEASIIRYARNWVKIYQDKGPELLEPKIFYRSYTLKDKVKAVRRVLKGESMRAVARDMGMESHSTVRHRVEDYRNAGIAGLQYRKEIKPCTSVKESAPMKRKLTDSEREELLALRKRNQILEAEVCYLKKLKALIAKEEEKDIKAKE